MNSDVEVCDMCVTTLVEEDVVWFKITICMIST